MPVGALLVGSGKCEYSSLTPLRPCDLHANWQAVRGKAARDGNGGDPKSTHGLRGISDARRHRRDRGIPRTDVRQLLGHGAIGRDDQIDFLECRLNRSPELVELVARRGIFSGRQRLRNVEVVPEPNMPRRATNSTSSGERFRRPSKTSIWSSRPIVPRLRSWRNSVQGIPLTCRSPRASEILRNP